MWGVMKGGISHPPLPNAYADRRRKGSKNVGAGKWGEMMVFGDKKFEKGSQLCAEMV